MMVASGAKQVSLSGLLEGMDVMTAVPDVYVHGIAMDSREIVRGDLFLACAGSQGHGMDYLQQAVANGASMVLADITTQWLPEKIASAASSVDVPVVPVTGLAAAASRIAGRFYGNPSHAFPVIGITGTNGKTSCSLFIAMAFADKRKVAVLGTLGNGFPGELTPSTHTTMDPVSVQAMLALLKARQAEMVAMEVSSHALHQGRVADVAFDMAVLTNFSRDHLDYHGTMADYASAKSLLFRMPGLKSVLINADDELGARLIRELAASGERVIAYGTAVASAKVDAWIYAEDIQTLPDGLVFRVRSSWGEADVRLSLLGRFNMLNAIVALGVLLESHIDFNEAVERLTLLETVPGRMQMFTADNGPTAVVDFAHTPDALEQVLLSLRDHVSGKLICVFGCGGDRDKGKRPLMGAIAERLADRVVLTDDNPRHEMPEKIIREIQQGMLDPGLAVVVPSRANAIRQAIETAGHGDVVLVAGKGHEAYQLMGDLKVPFSDQQAVQSVLEGL